MKHGRKNFLRTASVLLISAVLLSLFAGCGQDGTPSDSETGTEATAALTSSDVGTDSPEDTAPVEESIFMSDRSDFEFTQSVVCKNKIPASSYSEFMKKAEATGITVPALPEYFVPQGMDYWKAENVFIISGYFNPTDKYQYSVLFAVDADSGEYVGEWKLFNPDGQPHSGHDGGVAVSDTDIFLSTSSTLYRISLETVKAIGNRGNLKIDENIGVPVRASYCNYSCGYVWVGEFSLEGNKSYTITGHDYKKNHAWTLGYKIGDDGKLPTVPDYVISTPEKIQGFTVLEDGRVFITCSYGRTNKSTVYISKTSLFTETPADTVSVAGKKVPLYNFGSYESVTAIPMTEGCCAVGNKVYIIFESGAYYYRAASSSKSKDPTDKIWVFDADK